MVHRRKPPQDKTPKQSNRRRYVSRGVDVEMEEASGRVELTLDGIPIPVSVVDGEYHSQLANQFTAFSSVDEIVDVLLANEGRTWTLHGHVCDERCGPHGHHGDQPHGHGHAHVQDDEHGPEGGR
jgi:hypothetical protein